MNATALRGADIRAQARSGLLAGPTCGLAPDYLQANLVILPEDLAFDFLRFCQRNPKPCPILDVTEPGSLGPTPCGSRRRCSYRGSALPCISAGRVGGGANGYHPLVAKGSRRIPAWVLVQLRGGNAARGPARASSGATLQRSHVSDEPAVHTCRTVSGAVGRDNAAAHACAGN